MGNSYTDGNGKKFTRDQSGNMIVSRPDGTQTTYTAGSAGFNNALKHLGNSGGNWAAMGSSGSAGGSSGVAGSPTVAAGSSSGWGSGWEPNHGYFNVQPKETKYSYDAPLYGRVHVTDSGTSYSMAPAFTDGNGRKFERDLMNNLKITYADGTSRTVSNGTADFDIARRNMELAGGNWESMRPIENRSSSAVFMPYENNPIVSWGNQYMDMHNERMGYGPRPDMYIPEGLSNAQLSQLFGNRMSDAEAEFAAAEYERASMAATDAARAGFARNQNLLNRQREKAAQDVEDLNHQAYINHRLAGKSLDEEFAVYGINGGATESARMNLESDYMGNVNRNNLAHQNALLDYDLQESNLQYQYDEALANKLHEIAMVEADARRQAQARTDQMALQWASLLSGQNQWSQEMAFKQQQAQLANALAERDYHNSFNGLGFQNELLRDNARRADEMHQMELAMAGVNLNLLNKKLAGYGSSRGGYGSYASGDGAGVSIVSASGSGVSSVGNAPPTGNGGGGLFGSVVAPRRSTVAIAQLASRNNELDQQYNQGAISGGTYTSEKKKIADYLKSINY